MADLDEQVSDAIKGAVFATAGWAENELNQYLHDEDLVVSRQMQASIRSVVDASGESLGFLLGPTAEYAVYVHEGTGPAVGESKYLPPEGVLRDWIVERGFASGHGTLDEREDLLRWHIYHEGTRPNPFMDRFEQKRAEDIITRYEQELKKRTEQIEE